jgi:DNA-binding IclR family transcriptional regulator
MPTQISKHQYDNAAQQRILRLVGILSGHELHGLSPKDMADGLGISQPTITRDLHNLREVGFAEQIQETGRYRLSPKIVQIAIAHMTAMERAASQLTETKNRYSREP